MFVLVPRGGSEKVETNNLKTSSREMGTREGNNNAVGELGRLSIAPKCVAKQHDDPRDANRWEFGLVAQCVGKWSLYNYRSDTVTP